ncbi:MAG: hypothetical protein HY420_00870 [Candidatus Kerfeldbacteria bacterium]|nr:hypothetical protein [Candidatus Kerfeldbacteria bacterium]
MSTETLIFNFIVNSGFSKIAFGLLFLIFGYFVYQKKQFHATDGRRLFGWYFCLQIIVWLFVFSVTWVEWRRASCGAICQYFLPPYSNYYFNEVLVRWISTVAFNAGVGLLGGIIFSVFRRLTNNRVIDQLDVDLLTVGGMVAGWPNILIFYGLVFVLTMIVTVGRAVAERSAAIRMIVTPVLPLAAAAVAVFGDKLARLAKLYEIGLTLVS